jgi:hypothetical protein
MSWTEGAYNIFKKMVSVDSRIGELSATISTISHKLDSTTNRLASKIEEHGERLAQLEGKFELLEGSVAARRRKLLE